MVYLESDNVTVHDSHDIYNTTFKLKYFQQIKHTIEVLDSLIW